MYKSSDSFVSLPIKDTDIYYAIIRAPKRFRALAGKNEYQNIQRISKDTWSREY